MALIAGQEMEETVEMLGHYFAGAYPHCGTHEGHLFPTVYHALAEGGIFAVGNVGACSPYSPRHAAQYGGFAPGVERKEEVALGVVDEGVALEGVFHLRVLHAHHGDLFGGIFHSGKIVIELKSKYLVKNDVVKQCDFFAAEMFFTEMQFLCGRNVFYRNAISSQQR